MSTNSPPPNSILNPSACDSLFKGFTSALERGNNPTSISGLASGGLPNLKLATIRRRDNAFELDFHGMSVVTFSMTGGSRSLLRANKRRRTSWQRSVSASKSPESSGKTRRHLLLGAPIACSLRRAWPRENRGAYPLPSPGNFTELLRKTR